MRRFITGLVLVSALGCARSRDDNTQTSADPWWRRPSEEFIVAEDRRELSKDAFAVVTVEEENALAKLQESPWVKLSQQEAEKFLGQPFPAMGGEVVLLRGLSLNEANGAFSVTWRNGAVRVHHGCLGNRPMPTTRRAIVARLPAVPSVVYVDCSMAE